MISIHSKYYPPVIRAIEGDGNFQNHNSSKGAPGAMAGKPPSGAF
jgi:hypothetical protein